MVGYKVNPTQSSGLTFLSRMIVPSLRQWFKATIIDDDPYDSMSEIETELWAQLATKLNQESSLKHIIPVGDYEEHALKQLRSYCANPGNL